MISEATFNLQVGWAPLLVSLPHVGVAIPRELHEQFVPRALNVEDTDWHLDQLYGFVRELGASLIVPHVSRYVIDLNRPPENTPMYAGANNTELCPTRFFSGDTLYREGVSHDDGEIARRREMYWLPYHAALQDELARIKSIHGHAILFDGHSIKSVLPWLFDGQLPDLNLGTANGESCAASLRSAVNAVLASQTTFTHVTDGRFKGGYITRHYGRPQQDVHAVQLEMCLRCYMNEEPPWVIDTTRVNRVLPVLHELVQTMIDWRPC